MQKSEQLCKKVNKYPCIVTVLLSLIILSSIPVYAADPRHDALVIGSGTFESGNYSFPDTLEILNTLNVSNGALYVGSSGQVGCWQKGRGI